MYTKVQHVAKLTTPHSMFLIMFTVSTIIQHLISNNNMQKKYGNKRVKIWKFRRKGLFLQYQLRQSLSLTKIE